MNLNQLDCCGIRELSGISGYKKPEELLKKLCSTPEYEDYDYWGNSRERREFCPEQFRTGAFLFTQAGTKSKYGTRLAEYIKANNLGDIDEIPSFTNRNTGRKITLFVWRFNFDAIKAWWETNHTPKCPKCGECVSEVA